MNYVPLVVILWAIVRSCHAQCPHEDPGLAKFSVSFPGDLTNTEVEITSPVLLDVEDVSIKRLIISSDGKLVFGQGIDITLRTKAIHVKDNGQFIIGSKDCRHTDNVNIILQGKKSEFPELLGPDGEEKYFIVQDQGALNIYGAEKRAWTKITSTLKRWEEFSDDPNLVKFDHKATKNEDILHWKKGLAVYIIHPNQTIAHYTVVDLFSRNYLKKEQDDTNDLTARLNNLQDGQLVSIAVQDFFDPAPETDLSGLFNKIEEVTGMQSGELLLRQSGIFDAFTLMFIKGGKYTQSLQKLSTLGQLATAQSSLELGDYKVTSVSHIQSDSIWNSRFDLRILHKSIGKPKATVVHDVSSWNEGDKVILTSTDYDAGHTEVRTIVDIPSANEVVLSDELLYSHFGEIENRVDMRAEIALLTRNIKIQGEVQDECPAENGNCDKVDFDSFGGQLKISHSFGEVYIEGVEITQMGQLGVKGAYPVHFHMCMDVSDKISVLKNNAFHHTFQRAVTVHATFGTSAAKPGVVLEYNVAYDVFGHTFFLEDGVETNTIFIGNLGALTKNIETGFFATDATEAATFWITNPEVVMIGNVAAGSVDGVGIWYIFPDEPVGTSIGVRYQLKEAFATPLLEFDNNVAHSNSRAGFQMSKKLVDGDGNIDSSFKYMPRMDPRNSSSPVDETVQIKRLTVYKNKRRNAWLRGGAKFMQLSSAESRIGLAMARASMKQQQFASKLILVGASGKNGEKEGYPDAYTPKDAMYTPGVQLIYGPQYISHAWFTGFKSYLDGSFVSGAVGFPKKADFHVSELTSFTDFRFGFNDPSEGNKVFNMADMNNNLGHKNKDGNEIQSFRDVDGSVYACDQLPADGPKQFVKPEKFLLTDNCYCRTNWQMCVCDDLYGEAKFDATSVWSGSVDDFNLSSIARRIKYTDALDTAYEDHLAVKSTPRFMMVLGNQEYYYEVEFLDGFPKKALIDIDGVEWNNDVVAGVCLPEGAMLEDLTLIGRVGGTMIDTFTMGTSLQDVGSDPSMQTIYIEGRMLYLHFATSSIRDPMHDTPRCIDDPYCPRFTIQMKTDLPYTPCFTPTAEELSTDFMPELVTELTCSYPADTYESNWGVGDIFASHDGEWGDWSAWSACSSSPSSRTRTRRCDSPTPYGDGKDCVGETSETGTCPLQFN